MVNQVIESSALAVRGECGDILAGDGGNGEEVDVGVRKS